MNGGFIIDDVAMNGGFEDFRLGRSAIVIEHRAKGLHVLKLGSEAGSNHVIATSHTLDAVTGQVRVGLVGT